MVRPMLESRTVEDQALRGKARQFSRISRASRGFNFNQDLANDYLFSGLAVQPRNKSSTLKEKEEFARCAADREDFTRALHLSPNDYPIPTPLSSLDVPLKFAKQIRVGEEMMEFSEYVKSSEFFALLRDVRPRKATPVEIDGLQMTPGSHRPIDVTKSLRMARSPFRGGFLRDTSGHSKSSTAVLTALELQSQMRPRCGFILIACSRVSLTKWVAEIEGDSTPMCKYLILRHAEYPITELLEYDIVICTADFVTKQYTDCLPYLHRQAADRAMVASGKEIPDEVLPRNYLRVYMPLHSRLYDPGQLDKNIAVLILDDSHRIANTNSDLYQAIQQLRYHHALLITASPSHGRWLDFQRQMGLLPGGGPFLGEEHMSLILGTDSNLIKDVNRPQKVIFEILASALIV